MRDSMLRCGFGGVQRWVRAVTRWSATRADDRGLCSNARPWPRVAGGGDGGGYELGAASRGRASFERVALLGGAPRRRSSAAPRPTWAKWAHVPGEARDRGNAAAPPQLAQRGRRMAVSEIRT